MYPDRYAVRAVSADNLDFALQDLTECRTHFEMLAVDCETTGLRPLDDDLVLLTIATSDTAWVFTREFYKDDRVGDLLEYPFTDILAHYAPFDWAWIRHRLRIDAYPMLDTRRAAQADLLQSSRAFGGGTSLRDLTQTLLRLDLDKSLQTAFVGAKPPYDIGDHHIHYAGIDALVLWPIYLRMLSLGIPAESFNLRFEDREPMVRYLTGGDWPTSRDYPSLAKQEPETEVAPA